MEKRIKIIVADTNWWVSLVIKKFNNKFAELLESGQYNFVTSVELTGEIELTLSKPRLQKHLDKNFINLFWQQYAAFIIPIEVKSIVSACRDPKDNFLLALAKDSQADFLITGDKDLLILQKFEQTIICTLSDFIKNYLNK